MTKHRGLAIVHTLLALFVVALGVCAVLVATGIAPLPAPLLEKLGLQDTRTEASSSQNTHTSEELTPADEQTKETAAPALGSYSWEDLATIAHEIAAAPSEADARSIAASYGLISADGALTDELAKLELTDGSIVSFELVGIYHDIDAEGNPVGLSFMSSECVGTRAMNYDGLIDGGWEASGLRSYLNEEWFALLPEELSSELVAVQKLTNNQGHTDDPSSVTTTLDSIWVPSAVEICGEISWYTHEYTPEYSYLDGVANAEGEQYERFSSAGVSCYGAPDGLLERKLEGKPSAWWYRTPFYFVYNAMTERYFYSVLETGYPYGYNAPETELGIVVGFCL